VSDPHPARHAEREDKRTFLQKIVEFIHPGLDSKDELIETLAEAEDNEVIGTEARVMLEGVIRMADRTASDIMVAAPRMDLLDIEAPYAEMLVQVIRTAHSRFPVYEGERDNIIGILMAKDLLKLQRSPSMNVRALLRPVTFVPETKGLYDLLREFRSNRNHMSILVDEFGSVAGLVTMEDVLEEIFALADNTYRVAGHTPLERVEEAFNVTFPSENGVDTFETIGGWVSHEMGRLPKRGESLQAAGLRLTVLHAKGGAVRWFQVTRASDDWPQERAA
jgi:magnesium and cobalt transporter